MASTLLLHGGYALPSYAQAASDPSAATHPEPTAVASATPALPGMAAVPVQTTPQTQIVNAAALTGNTNLSVAPGQTLAINFGSQSTLNLTGNITNNGTIYAFSSNPAVTTATFAATNITNAQGALLSTMLPAGGLAGITSAVSNLNLSLVAVNNIINQGSIMSAGNLSMMAGGSITNALPQGITGPSPIMQAMSNLNMQASTITNSGLMAATTGNINILATLNSTLASSTVASTLAAIQNNNVLINNTNGVMEALNGVINVRDLAYVGKTDLAFNGGDVLSPNLNIFSGTGNIHVNTNHISGLVSGAAGALQIGTLTGKLSLGDWQLTGDPLVYSFGDIFLPTFNTPNEALTVVAGGSILVSPGIYNVNKLFMQAGSNFTPNFDGMGNLTSLTINNGRSATGGNIAEIGGGPTTFNVYASGAYAPFGTASKLAPVVGVNTVVCTNCNSNYSVFVNANNLTVAGLPNGPTGNILLPNTSFVVGNGEVSFYASGGQMLNSNGASNHGFLQVGNITNYGDGVTIRGNLVRGTAQILPNGTMTDNSLAAIDVGQNFSPVNITTGNIYSTNFIVVQTLTQANTGVLGISAGASNPSFPPFPSGIGFAAGLGTGPDHGAGAGNGVPFSLIQGVSLPYALPAPPAPPTYTQQPFPQPNPPQVAFPGPLPTLPPIGPPGPGPGPGPGGNPAGAQPGTTPGTTTQQPPQTREPIRITLDPRTNQQLLPPTTLPTDETPYYRPKYWWDSSDTSHSSDGLEQWVANDDGSETHLTKLQDDDGSWHWKDDNGQEWKPPEKILLAYSDDVDVIEDGKKMKFDLKATKDENVDSIKTKKDGYYDIRPKEPGFDIGHSPSDPSGQRDVPITHIPSAETGWSPVTSDTGGGGGGGGNFNLPPTKIDSKDVPANPINNPKDYKDFTAENFKLPGVEITGKNIVFDSGIRPQVSRDGNTYTWKGPDGNQHTVTFDRSKQAFINPSNTPSTATNAPNSMHRTAGERGNLFSLEAGYVTSISPDCDVYEVTGHVTHSNSFGTTAVKNLVIPVPTALVKTGLSTVRYDNTPVFQSGTKTEIGRVSGSLQIHKQSNGEWKAVGGDISYTFTGNSTNSGEIQELKIGKGLRLALRTVDAMSPNQQGESTLLMSLERDVFRNTRFGTIEIGKGSLAYSVEDARGLTVYCLESCSTGIKFTLPNEQKIMIQPGRKILLTNDTKTPFGKLIARNHIGFRNLKSKDVGNNLKLYIADFSILSAIATIKPLRRITTERIGQHKQIVDGMLKNAILLADITKADGPFHQRE